MKRRTFLILIIFGMAATGLYALKINFHTVIANEVYRSAQLGPTTLKHLLQKHKIRSVINLRGKNPEASWYQAEVEATAESDASHYDVDLTSTSLPRVDQLHNLFHLLNDSERPVLVHCASGADRSGLASAMALLMKGNINPEEVQNQSSWRYLAFSPDTAGKLFLEKYRQWLDTEDLHHNKQQFSKWVEDEYVDSNGNFYFLIHPINGQTWERPNGRYEERFIFTISRSRSSEFHLDGWAFDNLNETLIKDIEVYLDNIPLNKVRYGIYLPHLLNDFGKEAYLHSGWELNHPLNLLEDGCYDLTLHLTRLDGSKWISPPQGRICIH